MSWAGSVTPPTQRRHAARGKRGLPPDHRRHCAPAALNHDHRPPMPEASTTSDPPGAPKGKLSAELHALNARFGHEEIHLGSLIDLLGDRTYSLLVLLVALPLLTPATLLGIAFAVGPIVTALGLGLVFELHPSRLPDTLRARRLPPRFFGLLLRGAEKIIRLLERVARKRLPFFVSGSLTRRLIGAAIVAAALLLMVPFPLSNGPPAVAMICLAMGLLEEDGGMVFAGMLALLVTAIGFALVAFFGVEIVEHLRHWYGAHLGAAPTTVPPPTPTP